MALGLHSFSSQFFMAGTYHFDITALVRKANVAGIFCHNSSGNILGELSCNVVIFKVKSAISSSKISGILENSWEHALSVMWFTYKPVTGMHFRVYPQSCNIATLWTWMFLETCDSGNPYIMFCNPN